jgi:hypothetical protein
MHKLIFRAFPNHFQRNSIYAHFPFVVPPENKVILDKLGTSDHYSWEPPSRKGDLVIIRSYKAVSAILDNAKDFKVTWGPAIEFSSIQPDGNYAKNFCLAGDEAANTANRSHVQKALYPTGWREDVWNFYSSVTKELLDKYSITVATGAQEVDIVRDVINLANARFMSAMFSLPVKTESNPHGLYTEQEMYMVLMAAFASVFFDVDIAKSFQLRTTTREVVQQLGQLVKLNADIIAKAGFVVDALSKLNGVHSKAPSLARYGNHMIQRMLEKGKSVDETVWGTIMSIAAAGSANQACLLAQVLDYYLGDGKEYLPELYNLAHLGTKDADDKLMR